MRKHQQAQAEGLSTKYWIKSFKIVEDKGRIKSCHKLEETKEKLLKKIIKFLGISYLAFSNNNVLLNHSTVTKIKKLTLEQYYQSAYFSEKTGDI